MTPEAFWSRVEKIPFVECWLWTGQMNAKGYGRVGVNGRSVAAHRVAYEAACGPVPDGLQLDHLCRVRACVRPDHLEPVTRRVNILRGVCPPAERARQTLCIRGHELTWVNGRRYCLPCKAEKTQASNRKAKRCYFCKQKRHFEMLPHFGRTVRACRRCRALRQGDAEGER